MEQPTEFTAGPYETDDGKARKDCEQTIVYGWPIGSDLNPEFRSKWVDALCPHCNFVHKFKRTFWQEVSFK